MARILAVGVALVFSVMDVQAVSAEIAVGRIDTTPQGTGFRTWAANGSGFVISRIDRAASDGTSSWISHGAGGAAVQSEGVAATAFQIGSDKYEQVAYVGTNGVVYLGTVINAGPITWVGIPAPIGKTLTGNIAATSFVHTGIRYLAIGATTTDNQLYRNVRDVLAASGTWANASGGLLWLTDTPLAATTSTSGLVASIFASHSTGSESLGMTRWTSSGWATTNLGRPAGKRVCRSIAAAQGALSALSGSYRVLVACSPHNIVGELYIALATSDTSTSFSWTTYATPSSTWYQSLAAVFHLTNFLNANAVIDVYASAVLTNRLHKGGQTLSSFTITDIGSAPDGGSISGGLAAVPFGTKSRLFYIGGMNDRQYLYERFGGSTSFDPQNYRAFGDENPDGFFLNNFYAEGSGSIWHGTTAFSVIRRPGTGGSSDWPRIHFIYSPDESDLVNPPQEITNVVNGVTLNFVSDPTAAVTDQRTMYSMQIGVQMDFCTSSETIDRATVYAVSTTPSTFPTFSSPIVFESIAGSFVSTPIDHPYMDTERRSALPDILHAAWWVRTGATEGIRYSALAEGSTTPTVVQLQAGGGSAPRVTASNSGRVIVYYGFTTGNVLMCEVNAARTACQAPGWQVLPAALNFSTPSGTGPGVGGSSIHMRAIFPISMAVSETGDFLYYCYHRNETNGDSATDSDNREETDAFCTTASRDPSGLWVWDQTPVAIAGVTQDNKDQFIPEVVLTQEHVNYVPGLETAIVTFYDRTDDPGNYLYKIKKTISADRVITFFPPRAQFGGVPSDPEFLPRHCRDSNIRFIGDYSGFEGDVSHAQSFGITVPNQGTIGTQFRSNFNALGRWDR